MQISIPFIRPGDASGSGRNVGGKRKPSQATEDERDLPRTQDIIEVTEVRDNCLICKDGSVVAAVGFRSLDDTLMTARDIAFKQMLYYQFLRTIRFDLQFLIATRPQNLTLYYEDNLKQIDAHNAVVTKLDVFVSRMAEYVEQIGPSANEQVFEGFFGWHPNSLIGLPGQARDVAWKLCDPVFLVELRQKPGQLRESKIAELCKAIRSTAFWVDRWRSIILEQIDMVRQKIASAQAPVRVFYLVASYNSRITAKLKLKERMGDEEFVRARKVLDERCRLIQAGMKPMGLPTWRATHEDLLLDIRTFFNPSQAMLARRAMLAARDSAPMFAANTHHVS